MAIDPRKLKPGELARLLNSTPLGEVVSERQLHRHRTRAGFRVAPDGDAGKVDLFRYVAWLVTTRHEALAEAARQPEGLTGYEAMKERARQRNAMLSLSGRDIGELPPVADPARRERAARDFRFFCEAYFLQTFHLKWSDDHLKVIAKIEQAVLEGGLFAMAMPRGSGKTSLCEVACLWAMLYGHRDFVALIGSDEEHAAGMLESIKAELENSEQLAGDFPEVCHPIRCLEGIHQRASGQLYQGRQTHIGWTAREIVLPTIPGSAAAGAIIRVAGITGRIRGMKHKRADGTSARPSLVLIDDPQTDESARSPSQCANRERILAGAILGLAGPGRKIAGLMTLTVVRPDDLADRILDRDKHPQWQGERTKMVYAFPTAERLWAEYAHLRAEGLKADRGIAEATEFYGRHRVEMDAGAVVAWPERFNHDELSAVQHAINLRLQNEAAFFAEYQNEPLPDVDVADDLLSAGQIAAKVNCHARGLVPLGCSHLTMFVDVQGNALFYLVAAWEDDFTGHIIDYGTEPDQKQAYFTLRDVKRTLGAASPRAGIEGAIYAGLERLIEGTVAREWRRDDGAMVRIDRCLIDANWGSSTDVVYQFCRQSPHAGVLMPSHGRYVGASSIPFSDYKRKRGDRVGLNWRIPVGTGKRTVRHVVFDTNYWKSFTHARLAVPMGDPGCLSLFGSKAEAHRLLAEHLTSEYRVKTQGRGRSVDEWKLRVDGVDNHWLDCLVGAAVAASMKGAVLFGTDQRVAPRPRLRLSELRRARR
ncbi:MAG: phage terminase large subunit family protein [Parvibaculum sp.]|nr:phage terminase large subunit family protein [Parvibaculum sp.]MCW5775983.1 phage terminase large subunit family protein [Phycisphaeraceae bacterium]